MKTQAFQYFIRGTSFAAGAVFFVAIGVLFADSLNTFSSGETISSSRINANFQIAAPEGFIGAFYLSAPPVGSRPTAPTAHRIYGDSSSGG